MEVILLNGTAGPGVLLPGDTRVMLFTATSAWGAKETADGEPIIVEFVLPK